jgi:thioredoxin 1
MRVNIRRLEARTAPVAHGLSVVRFAVPLDVDGQRAARGALVKAGCEPLASGDALPLSSLLVMSSWTPPEPGELATVRSAVEALDKIGARDAWLFQVGTEIDARAAAEAAGKDEDDEDDEDEDDGEEDEDPGDRGNGPTAGSWKHGPPPRAGEPSFPFEGYPAILEGFDGDDFGVALKLGGPRVEGEEQLFQLFQAFWLRPYVDSDLAPDDDDSPRSFHDGGVTYDARHRSVLLWVQGFAPPATVDEVVHHLLWIVEAIAAIVPVTYGRFTSAGDSARQREEGDDGAEVVLAGNPFAARFEEDGEAAAAAWAETQRDWSVVELAAMHVEVGMRHDPEDAAEAPVALRLFDRALTLDPTRFEAAMFAQQVLVQTGRIEEALARAAKTDDPRQRASLLLQLARRAPGSIGAAAALLRPEVLSLWRDERLTTILTALANHAPEALEAALSAIPDSDEAITLVHAATFTIEDPHRQLRVNERVLAMPAPASGPAREEFLKAHNNACIRAHLLKDFPRAAALGDAAQPYAPENPYIYHSAACAYVAVGNVDKAFEQVRMAALADYDHLDKLEVDVDLGVLLDRADFKALFQDIRERHARSEPVIAIDEASFAADVLYQERPVLVDFTASWCRPCQALAPVIEKVALESDGRYRVAKVDIDECPAIAHRYGVRSVPSLLVFVGGEERARHVGLTDKATLRALIAGALT